jgi:SpoVK/Ycf46/Vps4 family AAA+-type ATPase
MLLKAANAAGRIRGVQEDVLTELDFIHMSGQDESDGSISGYERFDSMVGLQEIKKRVEEIVISIKAQKLLGNNGSDEGKPCYHMMFTGNPGTGKTEVARIIGRIFRENGLLSSGDLLEVSRVDLVGEYIGQTGPKTAALCHSALGSVLFIDEAYLLAAGYSKADNRDYGAEAIGALIAEMENHREQFVVILAGYRDEMERLFTINPGLAGRIPHRIHFGNYSKEELFEIFKIQVQNRYQMEDGFFDRARDYFLSLPGEFTSSKDFGNARFVRNLTERIRIKALLRMNGEAPGKDGRLRLLKADLELALEDRDIKGLNEKRKRSRLGFYIEN